MSHSSSVVAIYDTHERAEQAVKELQKSGFDMTRLSIIGKGHESEDKVIGYYNAGDRIRHWGKFGAFWGGVWGLLAGAGFFIIPGIGPVLIAGPLISSVVGALEGAAMVGGIGVIGASLYSLGIPKDSVLRYESAVKADRYLLAARGTEAEVSKLRDILKRTDPKEVNLHSGVDMETAAMV
jgi:hypothetical protein